MAAFYPVDGSKASAPNGEQATVAAVEALAMLVDRRDAGTSLHSGRVAALAHATALELNCDGRFAEDVYLAGRLHDIGKVAVPDSILRKRTALTEEEWKLIRLHPSIGADVVSHISGLARLVPIIRGHHERYDGSGYPDGLRGEAIPLGARIVAVADAFDAMISDRAYRQPMTVEEARHRLRECAGTQFDAAAVAALDRHLDVEMALVSNAPSSLA
ncbi:MAG TPA: HD domain-containing phosphohydrolase [Solirubrobacterales bacterium]|nr:HD domain-containing phosphohydrolase [Solirubrobacterales bacterium]